MKFKKTFLNSLTWFVLMSIPLGLMAIPSSAGSWSTYLEYNGSSTGGTGQHNYSAPWAYGGWSGDALEEQSAPISSLAPGQALSGSTSGNFVVVLTWAPSSPGETLPASVNLKIQQQVWGRGGRSDRSNWVNEWANASGTPGSMNLTAQVTAPDGQSHSDVVHQTHAGAAYAYSTSAQHPPALITVSTQGAQAQTNGQFILRHSLPSIQGNMQVTNGSFSMTDEDGTWMRTDDGGGLVWGVEPVDAVVVVLDEKESEVDDVHEE